jgi:hypothetical protein
MYPNESVVDDPVLQLIEWHSGKPSRSSDTTPSLGDEAAAESGPIEWDPRGAR